MMTCINCFFLIPVKQTSTVTIQENQALFFSTNVKTRFTKKPGK